MTSTQKIIKYFAIALAVLIIVSILGGIVTALGAIGNFAFGGGVLDEMRSYSISNEIKSLEIEIGAADLTIRSGDLFSVESNLKHITVKDNKGILKIEENSRPFMNYFDAKLILTIPEGTVFEKAELQNGAGKIKIETLNAKVVDCEFGAGEVVIDSLCASVSADIEGGAGRISIIDGSVNNLDFEMGVGKLEFTSALTGKCRLDLGVGETKITLLGNKDDYTLDIEKGLGEITVDGDSVDDVRGLGSGENKIDINGGIGKISLDFKKLD